MAKLIISSTGYGMLTKRLIARLDIKAPNLIKTVRLEGLRKLGDPYDAAAKYDAEGIDEIIYLDVVASLYGRNALHPLVHRTSGGVYCPLTVGGGVRSVADAHALFQAGADKVAVNTAAIRRPALIGELAQKFGRQAVVIQIDAKRKGNGYECWCDGGREPTGRGVVGWSREADERGAGELLITSIDQEGTRSGFQEDLVAAAADAVRVPVVASGGFGDPDHAARAIEAGASGVAVAHALHYETHTIDEIKRYLTEAGHHIRMI